MNEFTEQTDQQITEKQWLEKYDAALPEFVWFIKDYFMESVLKALETLRKKEDVRMMKITLNNIWFSLPDGKFNIMVNPKGWREFLSLIEE